MEERMLQRKLTLVPGVFAFALVSISWVTSTAAVRASEKCLTAPNAPAPSDEHWYYRTDRATNQQCWYLAPRDATVRKRTTERFKLSGRNCRCRRRRRHAYRGQMKQRSMVTLMRARLRQMFPRRTLRSVGPIRGIGRTYLHRSSARRLGRRIRSTSRRLQPAVVLTS